MDIREIVTGRTEVLEPAVLIAREAEPIRLTAQPGATYYRLWGTEEGASQSDEPALPMAYWPAPNGTRLVVVRWDPASNGPTVLGSPNDAQIAEAESIFPGLVEVFEPEIPGMHTSQTIDYGICLDGELFLILEGEEEQRITPGTCVIQRGTRHRWENRADREAVMAFVLIGVDDTSLL